MSSQIVILSRDTDCPSVAEIILFSAGETVVQPRILPQNKILSVDGAKVEEKRSEISPELTLEEKSKLNRANLRLQLKEKLDQIIEFLPRSEFLTPKQFSLVSTKLNAVLNIFGVADNKAKIKINAKRKGSKRLMAEEIEKNGEKKTE